MSLLLQRASDREVSAAACAVRPLVLSPPEKLAHRGRRSAGVLLRRRNACNERHFDVTCAAKSC